VVTHQLQVERRTAKERWPETDVLLLSHADEPSIVCAKVWNYLFKRMYCSKRSAVFVLVLYKVINHARVTFCWRHA